MNINSLCYCCFLLSSFFPNANQQLDVIGLGFFFLTNAGNKRRTEHGLKICFDHIFPLEVGESIEILEVLCNVLFLSTCSMRVSTLSTHWPRHWSG